MTPSYLPKRVNEEIHVSIEPGKTLIVKLLAVGQANPKDGSKDVYFQLNGENRVITTSDKNAGM